MSFPDDAYSQDPIAPVRVQHRVEFGDMAPGANGRPAPSHYYNYLTYEFCEGEHEAEAVAYLDEDSTAIMRRLDPPEWEGDFAERVLVFLSLRYENLEGPPSGAERRPIRLPARLADKVERRREEHITAMAT